MKQIKIVDTVSSLGHAEKYIVFKLEFKRFLKRKHGITNIKAVDALSIAKKYHLRGFVFGNYVNQEERYFFLYKIQKQLEILAELKGSKNLGKGILTVAFGAHGQPAFAAHYSPSEQLINLNRGRKGDYNSFLQGENSFFHEYGHFIDFTTGTKDKTAAFNNSRFHFPSEFAPKPQGSKNSQLIAQAITPLLKDPSYMKEIKHSEYLSRKLEIFARLFEAALTQHLHAIKHPKRNFVDNHYNEYQYYPYLKMVQHNVDKKCLQILKNF